MGNKILLMFVIMVLVIVVGTALDLMPTVLILTPILMPVVTKAGIDPVYFGVMFIMNNAIGLLTPPVGTVLNVVAGVARTPLDAVIKGRAGPSCWRRRCCCSCSSCSRSWSWCRPAGSADFLPKAKRCPTPKSCCWCRNAPIPSASTT